MVAVNPFHATNIRSENLKGRDHLENLGVVRKVTSV
jgi:hypothetical protein